MESVPAIVSWSPAGEPQVLRHKPAFRDLKKVTANQPKAKASDEVQDPVTPDAAVPTITAEEMANNPLARLDQRTLPCAAEHAEAPYHARLAQPVWYFGTAFHGYWTAMWAVGGSAACPAGMYHTFHHEYVYNEHFYHAY